MNIKLHRIICLAAFAFLFASSAAADPSPASEIKRQQKDFAVFKKGLLAIEAKVDRHVSMDSILQMLSTAEAEFSSKALTPIEEFRWYSRIVNLVQSGHTQVSPSRQVFIQYVRAQRSFPFDMVVVNKKIYAKGYDETKGKPLYARQKKAAGFVPMGAEIISIDGRTIPQWMDSIGSYIGSDEDDPVFEYFVAGQLFDFYRFLVSDPEKKTADIVYVSRNDTIAQTLELGLPPVKTLSQRFDLAEKQTEIDRKSIGKFKFIGSDVAYFRFPSFAGNIGPLYSDFLRKSFTKIKKKKKIETVIVDVRGNGGGIIQTELLSYFIETAQPKQVSTYTIDKRLKTGERKHIKKRNKEFRLYKKLIRQFERLERRIPGYKGERYTLPVDTSLIFKGNVIVLTDEGSFSAASMLAGQLKTERNALIMGSRPGGSYYVCNAGTLRYVLPNSKIAIILNTNTCKSMLDEKAIDPHLKDVDVEIVPKYDPKPANYKKNWEGVIKDAIREGKKLQKKP